MTKRIGAISVLGGLLLVAAALVVVLSNRAPGDVGDLPGDAPSPAAAAAAGAPAGPAVEPAAAPSGFAIGTDDGVPAALPEIPRSRLGDSLRIPVSLQIPSIGVDAPVVPVGVEDDGEMEVPYDVTTVGWYRNGSLPGGPGSAVLAAHVDLAGRGPGVFFDIADLTPGDLVVVDFNDGSQAAFEMLARRTYDRSSLPLDTIFATDGTPYLTLVTCGGEFDRSTRHYESNVVVYAVPTAFPVQPLDKRA